MSSVHVVSVSPSQKSWIASYLPVIEAVAVLLVAILLLWKGVIPGWRTLNTDFPNYYVVGRLIREHYCLDRIYDWIWFQRMADRFGVEHQLVGFLGLTPFSALPIVPLSWLPVLEAKRIWIVCNMALVAVSIHLLSRQTGLCTRRAWLIALCAVIPLRSSFLFGQMHILVLTLLVAAYVCHMRGWQISSGCCIALAAALKIYPIFFCLYFVVKRRWKALGVALLCTASCFLLSYLITGPAAMKLYLFQQLPRLLQGESGNPFLSSLTSSSALFHRLFLFEPELNPHPLVSSPSLYAVFYPLWQAILVSIVLLRLRTGFRAGEREALEWSMFLCLLMFLSSAPASYQFVALIAAAVPTLSVLTKRQRWQASLAYLLLYLAACNMRTVLVNHPVSIITPLLYLKLWAGVAMLIFYCTLLESPGADMKVQSKSVFRAPAFKGVAIMLGIWLPGFFAAWSHLKDMPVVNADRITPPDNAYLRIHPVNPGRGLLYVAMFQDGYRVRREDAHISDVYPDRLSPTNALRFAIGSSGGDGWVEVGSGAGSPLVHFTWGAPEPTACQIGEAEDPALSADGSALAFLREDRGHGSLWIVDPHDCITPGGNISPVRMTSPSYDVRTLGAGPSSSFLMSAIYQGRQRIFAVSSGGLPKLLVDDDGALDWPALSPNGEELVVRELVSARWQLVLLNLSSGDRKQLTRGDCNAYTPSWKDNHTLLYATDCLRGLGLTALASFKIDP